MRGDVAVVAHQPWEKNYGEGGGALPISALSPNGIGADTLQNGRSRSRSAVLRRGKTLFAREPGADILFG